MPTFTDLVQQGAGHAWFFLPGAVLLGALHGLEPGHSKTMMAAFIIAIGGTVRQAVLLGLCATLSHTLIVWVIALGGLYLWRGLAPETVEPWLQLASGAIILVMGAWMLWRTRREAMFAAAGNHRPGDGHGHGHQHGHDHHHHDHHNHHDEARRIDTGQGVLRLEIFETGEPPRFRLTAESGHGWPAEAVSVETERPDGARRTFCFQPRDGFLESAETIPEPHAFTARLSLSHAGSEHAYDLAFFEPGEEPAGLAALAAAGEYQDAHELAHANDIRRRFAGREVSTAQIALFGLTGGLIPCPGAITVLLLCLQLRAFALGAALVLAFSIGLALTMVASGVLAALSVRHVSRRFSGFGEMVRRAPYVSGGVILLIGVYLTGAGWLRLFPA